jgi:hypothetical protein
VLVRLLVPLVLALAACATPGSAQLRVLDVRQAPADSIVLHVQVVNRTQKAMRLQRLEYRFAGDSHQGQVELDRREIQPGAAAVVTIELDEPMTADATTLKGKLFAELDQIVQAFPVTAQVGPGS